MSTIVYQFRTVGAENARQELLQQAAAARELGKAKRESDRVAVAVARRTGRVADPQVAAERERTKKLADEAKKRQRDEDKRANEWVKANDRLLKARQQHADKDVRLAEQANKRALSAQQRGAQQRIAQAERVGKQMRYRETMAYEARGAALARGREAAFDSLNSTVVGGATAATAIGAAATRSYMANQQRARDLAVSGGAPDQAAALLADAEKTAKSVTGTKTEDVLAAQQKIVGMTGNLDLARSSSRDIATAARATGAGEEDIASMVATANQKFGISDPGEMRKAIATMINQGKSGAFEMKDAAAYFSELGASGQRFGLDKSATGFGKLGAMAQVARASTGSGAEAATGVQAMLRQLTAKSDDIKRFNKGKEVVFKDKGKTQTNDVVDVIANTLKASKGNKVELQKIFGDEGMKGASGFINAFNDAGAALGKGATEAERMAAGEAAVRKMFDDNVSAGNRWGDVVQDAAARTDSASARTTTAWETIVTAVGSAVSPALDQLSMQSVDVGSAFAMLAEQFASGVTFVADFIGALRKLGLIDGETPTDRTERLGQIRDELGTLGETEAAGKLGAVGKKRKAQLLKEQGTLVEGIAKDLGLTSATGGEYTAPQGPDAGPKDVVGQMAAYGYSTNQPDIHMKEMERVAKGPDKGILASGFDVFTKPAMQALNSEQGAKDMKSAADELKGAAKALAKSAAGGAAGNIFGGLSGLF